MRTRHEQTPDQGNDLQSDWLQQGRDVSGHEEPAGKERHGMRMRTRLVVGTVAVGAVLTVPVGMTLGMNATSPDKTTATMDVQVEGAAVGNLIEGQKVSLITYDYGVSVKGGMEIRSNRIGNVAGKVGEAIDSALASEIDYSFNPVRTNADGTQVVNKVGVVKLYADQGAIEIDVQQDTPVEEEAGLLLRIVRAFTPEEPAPARRIVVTVPEGSLKQDFVPLRGLESEVASSSPGNAVALIRSTIDDARIDDPNKDGQNAMTWDDFEAMGKKHVVESGVQFVEEQCAEPVEQNEFFKQGLESSLRDYTRATYADVRPDAPPLTDEEIIVQVGERVISASPAIDANKVNYQQQLDKAIAEAAKVNVSIALRPAVTNNATCKVNFDAARVVDPNDSSLFEPRELEVG